jgi:hypothetical protein
MEKEALQPTPQKYKGPLENIVNNHTPTYLTA